MAQRHSDGPPCPDSAGHGTLSDVQGPTTDTPQAWLTAAAEGIRERELEAFLSSSVGPASTRFLDDDTVRMRVRSSTSIFGLPDVVATELPYDTNVRLVVHAGDDPAIDLVESGELRATQGRAVSAFVTNAFVDLVGVEPPANFQPARIEGVYGWVYVVRPPAPPSPVNGIVSLAVAGGRAVAGHADGGVELWDIETGDRIRSLDRVPDRNPMVGLFSKYEDVVAAASGGEVVHADGTSWQRLGMADASATALVALPDGVRFVVGYADGRVQLWRTPIGGLVNEFALSGSSVQALAATDDWLFVVYSGMIWRADWSGDGVRPINGPGDRARVLAHRPGTEILLSGGLDGAVRTWNIRTGMQLGAFETGAEVVALTTTPDGSLIVTGHPDGTLRWWLPDGFVNASPVSAHTGPVTGLGVSEDGRLVVSAGEDGELRRWFADDGTAATGAVASPERLADVISDIESGEDRLGVGQDVQVIAAVLAALSTTPPLSVALLGDWGAGKSSFMRQLRARVDELAGSPVRVGGSPAFAANVRQVTFNAWHYSDDHLWVGIVEHLFRELRAQPAAPVDPTEVSQLEARLESEGAERDRLERDLDAVRRADSRFLAPVRSWTVFRAAVGGAWRELRSGGWRMWLGLAVLVGGIAAVVLGQRVLGIVGGLLGPAIAVWSQLGHYVDAARERLLVRKAELDVDIRATTDKLDELDPARRLDRLLTEITAEDRYATFRGLTGRIHHDLRRLSADLAAAREKWEGPGTPPLQRIVLYVDDLDRCTPTRVVDVLQAVNLLLTMDLFMVVVAVDPRWLLRSVGAHHGDLFGQDVGPVAYLDKIFHIPFALRPMGRHASTFLHSLLPDVEPAPIAPPDPGEWAPAETAETRPRTAPPPRRSADTATATDTAQVRVIPSAAAVGLRVTVAERDFLGRLAPLLTTPRAIKKLTNLYRLLRLSVPRDQLAAFLDGPYQAAALLLTALAGSPHEARALLAHLGTSTDADVTDVLKAADSPLATRLADLVRAIGADIPVHTAAASYRRWAGEVARFGFETYDLYTG
jgi:hypothetical protein